MYPSMFFAGPDEALRRVVMELRTSPAQEALERMAMQLRAAPWQEELQRVVGDLQTDGPDYASPVADMVPTREAPTPMVIDDVVARPPLSPATSRPRQRRMARLERRVAKLEAQLEMWQARWFLAQLDAPHPEDE